jgi:hypothetical protein
MSQMWKDSCIQLLRARDSLTIEEVMSMANEKWKYLSHKYSNLLKLYSKRRNETK